MKTDLATQPLTPSTALNTLLNTPNPTDAALVTPTSPALARSTAAALSLAQPSRKPRNGKIARLPKPVRDVVNRMLFHHIPQEQIVAALHELGIKVTQSNLSNWKTHGGYDEWRLAQEHAIQLRLHQDNLLDLLRRYDASELPEVGLQVAATQISQFFLTPEARQLLASNPSEYERRVAMLTRISHQVKALQKSRDDAAKALGPDHDPDRIRSETCDSLERLTDSFTAEIGDSPKDPDIPHRNRLPNANDLFNFTDRANDQDETRSDRFIEFMKALHQKSTPANEKPPSTI